MYIDSNIFIFAAMDRTDLGEGCRKVLQMIQDREITCASSYLTVDEVIWVLKKKLGKENAVRISKATLSLPVKWLDVDRSIISSMIDNYRENTLDPRDCLHLSSMKANGIDTILTEDSDFDNIKGIRRLNIERILEE